jgi:hypothetical protein
LVSEQEKQTKSRKAKQVFELERRTRGERENSQQQQLKGSVYAKNIVVCRNNHLFHCLVWFLCWENDFLASLSSDVGSVGGLTSQQSFTL